jgi:intein-encoded DNA endonuclease-like protein
MCSDLRVLGYAERKTESLAVPNIPKKYFSDFTRGYFDGDGNVWFGYMHKERQKQTPSLLVGFTSGSQNFLFKLKSSLGEIVGVSGSISLRKGKECWCLRYSTQDSLKLYNFMYNRTVRDLFLKRKKEVFEKYIQEACSRSSTG